MSILFCTPCYGGMAHAAHMGSCLNLKEELTKLGVEHEWLLGSNESLIHRGRMEMTATFLKTKFTHMMWLDSDIEFTPEDVAALWNIDADIAVGVYAMKKRDAQWFAAWKDGKLIKDLNQFPGPIEVDYAGTGFMLIRREVVESLAKDVPTFEGANGPAPALYQTPIHNGILESEDYFFCRLARENGFKIIMDPRVRLKHWGQYAYGA